MKVSFVVPTKDNARTITACVRSLHQQTHPDVEVVVVDNGSSDGTPQLARAWADQVVTGGPERSAQRNQGARLATGEVVLFVDSDMVLDPTVAAEIVDTFERRPELAALIIPERSFGEGFLAQCRVLEKSLYVGDDNVESPRAFRADVLARVGGWDETLTAAEDWELHDRVRRAGVRVGRIGSWIWHDEGRLRLRGTFGKKRYYGQWVGAYLSRQEGAGRHVARTSLFSRPSRLVRHPVRTVGMLTLKSVEAAGMYAGIRDARRQHEDVVAMEVAA